MTALERKAIGDFRIEEAVTLDGLTAQSLSQHLKPAMTALADIPQVTLSEAQLIEVRNGRPI